MYADDTSIHFSGKDILDINQSLNEKASNIIVVDSFTAKTKVTPGSRWPMEQSKRQVTDTLSTASSGKDESPPASPTINFGNFRLFDIINFAVKMLLFVIILQFIIISYVKNR